MTLDGSSRVAQSSRTASRVVDGQAVVIVIDRQHLHTLNGVGTFVWTHAERPIGIDQLVDQLVAEYEVPPHRAREEVLHFAGELVRLGALEVVA